MPPNVGRFYSTAKDDQNSEYKQYILQSSGDFVKKGAPSVIEYSNFSICLFANEILLGVKSFLHKIELKTKLPQLKHRCQTAALPAFSEGRGED